MSEPTFSGVAALPPHPSAAAVARPAPFELEIRFTGSGSEYFRIWIVNLLLTLVTLTLYHPWAKVRRVRYFYANTLIGDEPLGFHANPWKILRGYLLVGLMVGLYTVAGKVSPLAGLISFLILVALWPALLKSAMQFRLANTSWRGVRFRFDGSLGGAYRALLPWFVPGLFFIGVLPFVPDPAHPPGWYAGLVGIAGLAMLVLVPLLWWNLKKYQHDHFNFGPLKTGLKSGPGPFYGVFLKTFAITLLVFVVLGGVAAVVVFGFFKGGLTGGGIVAAIVLGLLAYVLGLLAIVALVGPYFKSRMQNLLWSRTGNRSMHFNSALRFWPLLRLTLKNWVLVILTLGLYWPFAAVALARMKLEAMSITSRIDPQTLVNTAHAGEGDAAGDAAGDLFGLDIGF